MPAPTSPSAEAIIPPAVVAAPTAPAPAGHAASAVPPARPAHGVKSAAAKKKLALARLRAAVHRVALARLEPPVPMGAVVPPPGYYPPGPYARFVYGGPPRGLYGGWSGYRGHYPYYP
jgi:hypothetical protein